MVMTIGQVQAQGSGNLGASHLAPGNNPMRVLGDCESLTARTLRRHPRFET
jgi:hypothetical protein